VIARASDPALVKPAYVQVELGAIPDGGLFNKDRCADLD
jgi:hypothetical protein